MPPQRFAPQLESRVGEPFDAGCAERDAKRLAASGDYTRTDFQIIGEPGGDALVFRLEDNPWGPNYFRIGLDMSTDFRGASAFNLKLSHNRHWLDAAGSEWRNQLQIGKCHASSASCTTRCSGAPASAATGSRPATRAPSGAR